jgi:hypothetical protein
MSKKILFGGAFVAILLITGIFIFNKRSTTSVVSSETAKINGANAKASTTITPLAPDVFIQIATSSEEVIKKSVTTSSAAHIRTGKIGRALITAPEKRMTLDSSSEITISKEENKKVSEIGLTAGSIWSRVEKIVEKGDYYQVKTQNAVASVRGTEFSVSFSAGTTTLLVTESVVAFTPLDSSGLPNESKTVLVSAGHKAARSGSGEISVSVTSDADKSTAWYISNTSDIGRTTIIPVPAPTVAEPARVSPPQTAVTSPTAPATTKPAAITGTGPAATTPTPLRITRIDPVRISAKAGGSFTLYGTGFSNVISVTLNQAGQRPVPADAFKITNDTTITGSFPSGILAGEYDVVVVTDSEQGTTLPAGMTVY